MNFYKQALLSVSFILLVNISFAQGKPIGYWRAHMPYNQAVSVATDGKMLYTAYTGSFATFDNSSGDIVPYSKVEGMSDVDATCTAYDAATNTVVIAYQNSNIDLFKDNTFFNLPDLKNKVISGTKNINSIYVEAGMAYLSTDIGILVIDLEKRNIKESYVFNMNNQVIPVTGFTGAGNYFYAVTPKGLFRADKNSPQLQNFAIWQRMDSTHNLKHIAVVNDTIFLANADSLFSFSGGRATYLYKTAPYIINHIDPGMGILWVSEYNTSTYRGYITEIDATNLNVVDSVHPHGNPMQIVQTADSNVFVADAFFGLTKKRGLAFDSYNPNGPSAPTAFDIYAYNHEVWVAHGGYSDKYLPLGNRYGISELKDNQWTPYTYQPDVLYDSVLDFVAITKNQSDGTVYAASFQNGLFILKPDGSSQLIKGSVFDPSTSFTGYQVAGLALDNNGNLWANTFTSGHVLYAKTPDGTWYKYRISMPVSTVFPNAGGPMVIDDYGQKWFVSLGGGGVVAFNDNGTPEDPSDDQSIELQSGVGYGNLPSRNAFSIAIDKNGDIWVGTDNGIGIISCGGSVFQGCDAQIPVVQYDQYAGYLFAGENVRTIAVDGANRKWVGTDNGVWLLSPDASKIINRFTQDNSPLPSNHIEKIAIDPVTGDVYIGTDQGLVSYHGTATDGGTTNSNVTTYPNPIPSGYSGTIAIKGLVANADVRITDISGQLVYRTTALGGQAVWNGLDYTGHRPQSGVYLIFVTNTDGSQTYAGKMVFMQ